MKSMMVCIATAGTMDEDFEPLSCLIACSGYSRCLQETCCQFGATIGGGSIDGGQLFTLRIWEYARTHWSYTDAFSIRFEDMQTSVNGRAHWWLLIHVMKDLPIPDLKCASSRSGGPIWK